MFVLFCSLTAFITATLKSWSLYIHGYTKTPSPQLVDHEHWSSDSTSSASPCEEPGGFAVLSTTGSHSTGHSWLIAFGLVLWKTVILTGS